MEDFRLDAARGSVSEPRPVRVALMRGGTSKGVFLRDEYLPPAGESRDAFLLALMGSPDPMQLDGLGGTHSSTSKVVAVAPGSTTGIDVEYLFAQVGVESPEVDYASNCGNLTAAVGPFAIDEGLVEAVEPITRLALLNRNTGAHIEVEVPVVNGRAATTGEAEIPGVPGKGAPIRNRYLDPGGAVFAKTLPSGSAQERIETPAGDFEVSLVDVGHPVVFLRGSDLNLAGDETPAALNARSGFRETLEEIRQGCAARLGRRPTATVPRLVLLFPVEISDRDGDTEACLRTIGVSVGKVHHALPLTSAICTAAAASLEGTLAWAMAGVGKPSTKVSVWHPKGRMQLEVSISEKDRHEVRSVTVIRTARRLLEGTAFVPAHSPESQS